MKICKNVKWDKLRKSIIGSYIPGQRQPHLNTVKPGMTAITKLNEVTVLIKIENVTDTNGIEGKIRSIDHPSDTIGGLKVGDSVAAEQNQYNLDQDIKET